MQFPCRALCACIIPVSISSNTYSSGCLTCSVPRLTFKVLITLTELNHPGDDSLSSVSASGYQSRGKVAFRMTWAMLRTKLGGKVFCKTLILTFFNSIFDLGFILPAASLKRWQALEQGGKMGMLLPLWRKVCLNLTKLSI